MPKPDPRDFINKRLECGCIASFPPRLFGFFLSDTAYLLTFVPCSHALYEVKIYPQNFIITPLRSPYLMENRVKNYDNSPGEEITYTHSQGFRFVYKRVAR